MDGEQVGSVRIWGLGCRGKGDPLFWSTLPRSAANGCKHGSQAGMAVILLARSIPRHDKRLLRSKRPEPRFAEDMPKCCRGRRWGSGGRRTEYYGGSVEKGVEATAKAEATAVAITSWVSVGYQERIPGNISSSPVAGPSAVKVRSLLDIPLGPYWRLFGKFKINSSRT